MTSRVVRSYLFVPGNRPERFAKAFAAGAGALIIDLEDAVPPAEKASAREAVAAWLNLAQPAYIRINGADTEWFREDVEMCAATGVAGVVLPKAEKVEDIAFVTRHSRVPAVLPLIETAAGMWNVHAIAHAELVRRVVFGSIDFQLDLGIDGEDEELLAFRSQLVLVSRLAGIEAPVDGVTTAIDDTDRVRDDTHRGRRLGFGAKLCIHPKQVAVVNECFRPSEQDIAWATRVLEAAAAANGAAVAIDGKMVDRPVIRRAQEILEVGPY